MICPPIIWTSAALGASQPSQELPCVLVEKASFSIVHTVYSMQGALISLDRELIEALRVAFVRRIEHKMLPWHLEKPMGTSLESKVGQN